jgi:hypothetical protein
MIKTAITVTSIMTETEKVDRETERNSIKATVTVFLVFNRITIRFMAGYS